MKITTKKQHICPKTWTHNAYREKRPFCQFFWWIHTSCTSFANNRYRFYYHYVFSRSELLPDFKKIQFIIPGSHYKTVRSSQGHKQLIVMNYILTINISFQLRPKAGDKHLSNSNREPSVQQDLQSGTICRRTSVMSYSCWRHFHLVSETEALYKTSYLFTYLDMFPISFMTPTCHLATSSSDNKGFHKG